MWRAANSPSFYPIPESECLASLTLETGCEPYSTLYISLYYSDLNSTRLKPTLSLSHSTPPHIPPYGTQKPRPSTFTCLICISLTHSLLPYFSLLALFLSARERDQNLLFLTVSHKKVYHEFTSFTRITITC